MLTKDHPNTAIFSTFLNFKLKIHQNSLQAWIGGKKALPTAEESEEKW